MPVQLPWLSMQTDNTTHFQHIFSDSVTEGHVFSDSKEQYSIELFHVTSHVQIMTWHKKAAILVHIENVWAKIETS